MPTAQPEAAELGTAVPETAVAEVVRAAYVDPSDPTKLYVEAAGPRARRGGHSFRE